MADPRWRLRGLGFPCFILTIPLWGLALLKFDKITQILVLVMIILMNIIHMILVNIYLGEKDKKKLLFSFPYFFIIYFTDWLFYRNEECFQKVDFKK